MSLYNVVNGINKYAKIAALLLQYPEEVIELKIERLRDIFIEREGDDYRIRVHTRTGGTNREYHEESIKRLQDHPWFISDEDCTHDSTYADFLFRIPDKQVLELNEARKQVPEMEDIWASPVDHAARLEVSIQAIRDHKPNG